MEVLNLKLCQRTDVDNDVIITHDSSALARIWDGGMALSRFCTWQHRACSMEGRVALELGAGTGVVGLTLGRLGAKVTLTDKEPMMLSLMEHNISSNALRPNMRAHRLDWGDASTYLLQDEFDLIVGSDVLFPGFEEKLLANAIDAHVKARSRTEVLFCFKNVYQTSKLALLSILGNMGYLIERLENAEGIPVGGGREELDLVFKGSRFVALPLNRITDALDEDSLGSIQIFSMTKPYTMWTVKSGLVDGGILVRTGEELTSPAVARLSVGATIEELEMSGNRMHYRKISGDGPVSGWVSVSSKETLLLQAGSYSALGPGAGLQNDETEQMDASSGAREIVAVPPYEESAQHKSGNKIIVNCLVQANFLGAWEEFSKVPSPHGFGLRTGHGTFLSARDDLSSVTQVSDFGGAWEEFVEVPASGGLGLKTSHGTFISATKLGGIVQRKCFKGFERFLSVPSPRGFGLRTAHHTFVSASWPWRVSLSGA